MSSVNVLVISGNIGSDPEMSYTSAGIAVTRFSVAVDDWNSQTKSRETMWINCIAFRETAERIAQWCQKGTMVVVTGKLQYKKYQKNDGRTGYSTSCIVNQLEIMARGRPKTDADSAAAPAADDLLELDDPL
jgi:single-strand DNA-binding protein